MKKLFGIIWRSLIVGAGYAGALALSNALQSRSADLRMFAWSFAGGMVIGLTLGPLAQSMPTTRIRHMLVWGTIIFFNNASLTVEGRLFLPAHVQSSMVVQLLQQLLVALAVTWLIVKLFAPIAQAAPISPIRRSWFSWLWPFVVSTLGYVVFYYFFGAIDYLLVTGPYYKTHVGGLVTPAPGVILQAELIRAPLIILSVIPFLLIFRATRKRMLFLTGIILFAVGGIAPLLMDVGVLPLTLLAASTVEIFCQNFAAGVVAARLLARPVGIF